MTASSIRFSDDVRHHVHAWDHRFGPVERCRHRSGLDLALSVRLRWISGYLQADIGDRLARYLPWRRTRIPVPLWSAEHSARQFVDRTANHEQDDPVMDQLCQVWVSVRLSISKTCMFYVEPKRLLTITTCFFSELLFCISISSCPHFDHETAQPTTPHGVRLDNRS